MILEFTHHQRWNCKEHVPFSLM